MKLAKLLLELYSVNYSINSCVLYDMVIFASRSTHFVTNWYEYWLRVPTAFDRNVHEVETTKGLQCFFFSNSCDQAIGLPKTDTRLFGCSENGATSRRHCCAFKPEYRLKRQDSRYTRYCFDDLNI